MSARIKTPSFSNLTSTSANSSKAMQGNRARGTAPETLLGQALRRHGARYTSHVSILPGRPDIVFHTVRLVVFCDGDFWHGRKWTTLKPVLARRANAAYWIAKIASNRARDRRQVRALRASGWKVVRFWEGDIRRDPNTIAVRILALKQSLSAAAATPKRPIRKGKARV
jgi:DNA mismatch endonuclease (patch repair protein)